MQGLCSKGENTDIQGMQDAVLIKKSSHFIQTLLFSVQEAGSLKKILGKL